jgi:hypothetical protein
MCEEWSIIVVDSKQPTRRRRVPYSRLTPKPGSHDRYSFSRWLAPSFNGNQNCKLKQRRIPIIERMNPIEHTTQFDLYR